MNLTREQAIAEILGKYGSEVTPIMRGYPGRLTWDSNGVYYVAFENDPRTVEISEGRYVDLADLGRQQPLQARLSDMNMSPESALGMARKKYPDSHIEIMAPALRHHKRGARNPRAKFKVGETVPGVYAHLFARRDLTGDVVPVSDTPATILEVREMKDRRGRIDARYLVEVNSSGLMLYGWVSEDQLDAPGHPAFGVRNPVNYDDAEMRRLFYSLGFGHGRNDRQMDYNDRNVEAEFAFNLGKIRDYYRSVSDPLERNLKSLFLNGYYDGKSGRPSREKKLASQRNPEDWKASDYATPRYTIHKGDGSFDSYFPQREVWGALRRAESLIARGLGATIYAVTPEGKVEITRERLEKDALETRESNPEGDFEDRKAADWVGAILKSMKRDGHFYDVMRENGRSITIAGDEYGPVTIKVKDQNQRQQGPTVVLPAPDYPTGGGSFTGMDPERTRQIQDVYHYALHYGSLEGWQPDSHGEREQNPAQGSGASAFLRMLERSHGPFRGHSKTIAPGLILDVHPIGQIHPRGREFSYEADLHKPGAAFDDHLELILLKDINEVRALVEYAFRNKTFKGFNPLGRVRFMNPALGKGISLWDLKRITGYWQIIHSDMDPDQAQVYLNHFAKDPESLRTYRYLALSETGGRKLPLPPSQLEPDYDHKMAAWEQRMARHNLIDLHERKGNPQGPWFPHPGGKDRKSVV